MSEEPCLFYADGLEKLGLDTDGVRQDIGQRLGLAHRFCLHRLSVGIRAKGATDSARMEALAKEMSAANAVISCMDEPIKGCAWD